MYEIEYSILSKGTETGKPSNRIYGCYKKEFKLQIYNSSRTWD